jgi:type II secretory pathway pseudopilin PulG
MSITLSRKGGPSGPPFRFLHRRLGTGYSIVELALMLVLVALVAAAVPIFFQGRDLASDNDAKEAARTAEAAALEIAADDGGRFDGPRGVTVRNLVSVAPSLVNADLRTPIVHRQTFTLTVKSGSGNVFNLTRARDGATERTCSRAGTAGCPADGTW